MERQMDQWGLVIKVKHGDTLRRIGAYVHGQLIDLNMGKLRYKIISLFKISHDAELILTYTDEDGDIVTLDNDDELRDAVISQRLNPLRMNVQLKSPDSSDARTERSSPSSSVNAPWRAILPTVDEQENTIPERLLGVVSNLVGIAHETLSSSPAFAQKVVDIMKFEPFKSTMESLPKDVKLATSFSPALAQVVEHLSNLGLSNAGQTSGPSGESSGVPRGASTHQMDLNVSEEPKDSTGSILEATELPRELSRSVNQIPNENGSSNMVVQGAGVMAPSVDRNVDATKNGRASLYPSDDDLLASICTANNFPENEGGNTNLDGKSGLATATAFPPANEPLHVSGNGWTPLQLLPTNMDVSAGIMNGGSSSKQPPMKADISTHLRTGFHSPAMVPISGPFGGIHYEDASMVSEGMKTHPHRRPHIINDNMPHHRGVQCDGCGMHPIVGPRSKSNVKEDYDLCNICFTQMGNDAEYTRIDHSHPRRAMMVKAFRTHHAKICYPPPNALHGCSVRPQRTMLESRFIQDVTVLDGTEMPTSTHFTKIWRLRNNGNVPWPFGTQLVWVGGDQFGDRVSARLEIPQNGVPVDEELDIAVDFTAPSRPGRYVSYWRMASPSGQKFGQRVWVFIQVYYSPPNSAAGSSSQPDLNLNLPPESNGRDGSAVIDVNAVPREDGFPETNFSGTNEGLVEHVIEYVSTGQVDQPAHVAGGLMDGSNDELSQPTPVAADADPAASYPLIDLQVAPSDASPIAATAGDGNHVEQTMLKELEEMGFKQIDLNKEILRLNEYDLEQSVDDLCGFADCDPLVSGLMEWDSMTRI